MNATSPLFFRRRGAFTVKTLLKWIALVLSLTLLGHFLLMHIHGKDGDRLVASPFINNVGDYMRIKPGDDVAGHLRRNGLLMDDRVGVRNVDERLKSPHDNTYIHNNIERGIIPDNNNMPETPNILFHGLDEEKHGINSRGKFHPEQMNNLAKLTKKDWHDYAAMKADRLRTGLGEQGKAYNVAQDAQTKKKREQLFSVNGFNALASDGIALDRSLPDIRHPLCKTKKYLPNLPNVSIVIPFHQEHWTTLLRSVHSVINRSPHELIHEIILVDDFSTKDFLKEPLERYLAEKIPARFQARVIRMPSRQGLIRARLAGAKVATGQVLIFLDSHIECNVNWLPPLLEPIAENYRTVVCPFIDVIDYENFEYRAQDEGARGAFDWELYYKRLPLLPEDLAHPADPFKSPVMAGGLFAMDRNYFWELGGYDTGLMIWGGEQYELSFKIWQCGGSMVDAPCSRVGHIYRKYAPFPNPQIGDFVGKNYKRVAEVWMDEYKEYIYMRRPQYRDLDPGDLTEQKALRERLHCKNFSWFMHNISFDLPLKYPMIEPPDYANGEVRSIHNDLCLEVDSKENLIVNKCVKDDPSLEGDQFFIWSFKREIFMGGSHKCLDASESTFPSVAIRNCHGSLGNQCWNFLPVFIWRWKRDIKVDGKEKCLDVPYSAPKTRVSMYPCHGMKGNQWWRYMPDKNRIYHHTTQMCLDFDPEKRFVFVDTCNMASNTQQWSFAFYNQTIISNLPP